MSRLNGRLRRLEGILPPPPPAPRAGLSDAELRKLPTAELLARFEARLRTPEALARQAELEAMSDEELLAVWARRP